MHFPTVCLSAEVLRTAPLFCIRYRRRSQTQSPAMAQRLLTRPDWLRRALCVAVPCSMVVGGAAVDTVSGAWAEQASRVRSIVRAFGAVTQVKSAHCEAGGRLG